MINVTVLQPEDHGIQLSHCRRVLRLAADSSLHCWETTFYYSVDKKVKITFFSCPLAFNFIVLSQVPSKSDLFLFSKKSIYCGNIYRILETNRHLPFVRDPGGQMLKFPKLLPSCIREKYDYPKWMIPNLIKCWTRKINISQLLSSLIGLECRELSLARSESVRRWCFATTARIKTRFVRVHTFIFLFEQGVKCTLPNVPPLRQFGHWLVPYRWNFRRSRYRKHFAYPS